MKGWDMAIQERSQGVVLVELPKEPLVRDELEVVLGIVRHRGGCEVVVDFSEVDIITSVALSSLLKLQKLLGDCGGRLVLCNVAAVTRGILSVVGVDGLFVVHEGKFGALETVHTGA
jgi:anti-anti-sigma regulatory factor